MMENLQQLVNLVAENPDLKGSFIDELFQTMLSGEFTDIDSDVKPTDKVVGEMNDLDKALITLSDRYTESERKIVGRFRRVGTCDENIEAEEEKQMKADLQQSRDRFEIAENFHWANVRERFGDFDESESMGFAIRAGHKVVLFFDNHDHYNFLMEGILALRIAERMTEH